MESVAFDDLPGADLVVDRVYQAGPDTNKRGDPLQRLLPVGNQGGFRYRGSVPRPRLVVLYTTGGVPEWPDELDEATGTFTYFGDNKHPGKGLHDTARGGNLILHEAFASMRDSAQSRAGLPVFLVFSSSSGKRDVRFRGLAVPGSPLLDRDEELAAVWRAEKGERFQNYRSKFTILDVPVVARSWIDSVLAGEALAAGAPEPWLQWVHKFKYLSLSAPPIHPIRSRAEQLPPQDDRPGWALLDEVYRTYRERPVGFERAAVGLAQMAVPLPTTMDVTRPSVDGGRDAVGLMQVGYSVDPVWISLALEAKCYQPGKNSVGVKETSRLISRLRHRDLGFMVTTSFVARQAYEELREDRHPVVVLSGGDLVRELRRRGVSSPVEFALWAAQYQRAPAAEGNDQSSTASADRMTLRPSSVTVEPPPEMVPRLSHSAVQARPAFAATASPISGMEPPGILSRRCISSKTSDGRLLPTPTPRLGMESRSQIWSRTSCLVSPPHG